MPPRTAKPLPVVQQPQSKHTAVDTERCGNCRFWVEVEAGAGECHRHAPQPVIEFLDGRIGNEKRDAASRFIMWPTTEPHEYCGEFRPENS
jgi:hypothetical protein